MNFFYDLTLTSLISFAGALLVFGVSYCQYLKTQKWKRAEFVYQLMQNFSNDFNVRRAFRILDWSRINVPLAQNEFIEDNDKDCIEHNCFSFEDTMLIEALQYHGDMKDPSFSDKETIIRFIFDEFFDKLGLFNRYIEQNLIDKSDIEGYLIYWIKIIADKENFGKDPVFIQIRKQMWRYIIAYKYTDVIALFKKFGYDIES